MRCRLHRHGGDSWHSHTRRELCRQLVEAGKSPQIEVRLRTGVADVVTDDTVYEIKYLITITDLRQAIGQLVLYGACLPGRKLCVVGAELRDPEAARLVKSVGIDVLIVESPEWRAECDRRDAIRRLHTIPLGGLQPFTSGKAKAFAQEMRAAGATTEMIRAAIKEYRKCLAQLNDLMGNDHDKGAAA